MSSFKLLYSLKRGIIVKIQFGGAVMQTDKRIVKTRNNIKNAFMNLVFNIPMARLNISELATAAGVNRSTFYLHYHDIAAVAQDIEKNIAQIILQCLEGYDITDVYGSNCRFFKKLTEILDSNETIKKYIFFSQNSETVIARLKEILVDKTKILILRKFHTLHEGDIIYRLTYAAAGIVDCYAKWVREQDEKIPPDYLIKEISSLTEPIIHSITITAK